MHGIYTQLLLNPWVLSEENAQWHGNALQHHLQGGSLVTLMCFSGGSRSIYETSPKYLEQRPFGAHLTHIPIPQIWSSASPRGWKHTPIRKNIKTIRVILKHYTSDSTSLKLVTLQFKKRRETSWKTLKFSMATLPKKQNKVTNRPLKIDGWKMHFLCGPGPFSEVPSWFSRRVHSLKLTWPLKIGQAPKGNTRIPTIHSQLRTVC